jgi:hypothetical protein
LYEWIINYTPAKAVFICDPEEPVKMSGNVSELPAFTARSLFVDSRTYLTDPYEDRMLREHIAHLATNGQALSKEEIRYLSKQNRPLFVITFHADEVSLFNKLKAKYDPPIFEDDFVAVFNFPVPSNKG